MLLTITTTHQPATDLGYLLHKHPARCQTFDLHFGQVHIFYPEATAARCTAAMLLDVDPVRLVRRHKGSFMLTQHTNDRPYTASSFLSTAIAQVYGSALNGRSTERQDLAETAIDLRARLAVIPSSGGVRLLEKLFAPLGYEVEAVHHPLDPYFPQWGESHYFTLTLRAEKRLSELLTHLYVLVPVLDDDKHYYVGKAEIDKLLQRGEGWLADHPERRMIARRYLRHQRALTRAALARLADEGDLEATRTQQDREEEKMEKPLRLHEQRLEAVFDIVKASGARRVLDLGCGEGKLLQRFLDDPQFEEIVGVDVSSVLLERAARRLRLEQMLPEKRGRLSLLLGALTYRDRRLAGYGAAALVEVIEHVDQTRLPALEQALFATAHPPTVVITTPNAEYNQLFTALPADRFRHRDHRFEWTRAEFQQWARDVAARFHYGVEFRPVGTIDEIHGAPSQMAIFRQQEER